MGQLAIGQIAGSLLSGAWVLGKDYLLPAAWMLGKEYNQHRRSNHLHQENLAQMLRIHEAEACAAMEYHRVAMRMANEEHEKGITQARIMHEEDMDLEKRIAVRENLRDEWTQLTERAGTVLIVNTLVLSVAFGMLIDGPLPDSITLTRPTLVVAYFCLLSSSINLLLCSVRFAMLLRFRIGKIIVGQMKDAINKSTKLDAKYRDSLAYTSFNKPSTWVPACDDEERKGLVQPLTVQLEPPLQGADHDDEGHQDLAFVVDVPNRSYRNLRWLHKDTGYAAKANAHRDAHLFRTACRRRARQTFSNIPEARVYGATDALPDVLANCPRRGDAVLRSVKSRFQEASETGMTATQKQAGTATSDPCRVAEALASKGFTVRQLLMFYKLKEINGSHRTEYVVENHIVPETACEMTCYMDSKFMKDHGGPQRAKTFVSHAWQSTFLNTVLNILLDASGLSNFELRRQFLDRDCEQLIADEALDKLNSNVLDKTYWLCMFAINQHRSICHDRGIGRHQPMHAHVDSGSGAESVIPCDCGSDKYDKDHPCYEMDKFEDVVALMESHIVSLDPELKSLERLWIMAEIDEGVKSKPVRFRVAFDLNEHIVSKLRSGDPADPAVPSIEECKVTDPLDRQRIMEKIVDSGGPEALDCFMKSVIELNFGIFHHLHKVTGNAAGRLAQLRHLDLDCSWDRNIQSLADLGWNKGWEKLVSLQQLRMNFHLCHHLTDISDMRHVFQDMKSLRHLEMSFFACMHLADISHIGRALEQQKSLKTFRINLRCCRMLTGHMRRDFHRLSDFLKALYDSEYQQALKDRCDQDHELEKALEIIRDARCKPWDKTSLALFFVGSVCLIIAACLLVMGRYLFPIVPLPPGADTFPPAKLAAIGFLCPCVVTAVVYVIVHKDEEDVSSYVNEVTSGHVKAEDVSRSNRNPPSKQSAGDALVAANHGAANWKKVRLAVHTVNHWKRATDHIQRSEESEGSVWTQVDSGPAPSKRSSVLSSGSLLSNETSFLTNLLSNDFNLVDGLPYKTSFWIFTVFLLNFMSFLTAALVLGPPELPAAAMEEGASSAPLLDERLPLLMPLPLALAQGTTWPPFWEPAGATWWPSRRLLLLVGGVSLIELHVDGGRARLSNPRRVAEMMPLADICVPSGRGAEEAEGFIWLASMDSSFTVFRYDQASQVESGLLAGNLFPDSDAAGTSSRDGLPSIPMVGFARAIRAMACRQPSQDDTDFREAPTQLWLAANEGLWPVVIGTAAARSDHSAVSASTELRWTDTMYRWPTQWLTVDRSLAVVLSSSRHGITVESIEVAAAGLLLLLTSRTGGLGKMLQQLVVAVNSTGHLRKWWTLAPPGGADETPGALLGVRRWVALAADWAERQLYLVAGGPQPLVSVAPLPEW